MLARARPVSRNPSEVASFEPQTTSNHEKTARAVMRMRLID